jgi:hypothetical protein
MCPRDLVQEYGRDVMIPFPSIGVLAVAKFVRKMPRGVIDRLTTLCKRYHLYEKVATAAAAYNESNGKGFFFITDSPARLSCVGKILPRTDKEKKGKGN